MTQLPVPASPSLEATAPSETPPIRLLVLDLDGTIVGSSNQIRPTVKRAIQAVQAKGVQVAIATGRMYRSALRFHQDLGSLLPLMSYQGALIKHPADEVISRHLTVPKDLAVQLLDYFDQPDLRQRLSVHAYIDDRLYVRELTPDSVEYAKRSNIEPIVAGRLQDVVAEREPTKLLALCEQPALIDQVLVSLGQLYSPEQLYFTKSVATFFEATHPNANKGNAVQYLAETVLGLRSENVMAIGDNFNDLEMIQYAGVGVAMGGAPDAVKAQANWVAPDVEADGAVAAIEQFVLR
ncbi:MAG: HAD family phosphatase [Oscillatoriophycideae cyanobacterium NC_groundwater_1537_Pr4_S-0.65um_50_18]|nr:HAD family phosphatase [Oscillatoriophycideae cyanobacterium NC_groundwater_1537_Pr4_S-0.65um_50_18]